MLLSMTGYGDARQQNERLSVAVEVRSVNNRYLKISTKCPDTFAPLEGEIEKFVRASITRGTVSLAIRADSLTGDRRFRIDQNVLHEYWKQLREAAESLHAVAQIDLAGLLVLPGVVSEEDALRGDRSTDWPLVKASLEEALEKLQSFRATEGMSMQQDLQLNAKIITGQLKKIIEIAPQVSRNYRDRLHERVSDLLKETDAEVNSADLIREVSIFADRCDINEEITRLQSHLEQFEAFLNEKTSQGRKLEFLSQEMFREINTIGSKANNVEIAHSVVEMKASIEKMREILQNVE